jgi:hypothetical protein
MSVLDKLDGAERYAWSDERGALTLARVRDGVALIVMEGRLGDEAAAAWQQHFPWAIGRGKVQLFVDGTALTFPSTSFISTGTTLVTGIRPRLDDFHVLIAGGLTEMLAKTVNMTLGGVMRITRDREQFEAALRLV